MTARQAQNQLAGAYHSVFKGLGLAFSEVRQYSPGDDVRMIDWNVTARMREPYVKLFVEEREMTVMLLVDASRLGRVRHARAGQARGRRRDRRAAGVLRDQEQRPRRAHHLHRQRRAVRAAEEGRASTCWRSISEILDVPAEVAADRPARRARVSGRRWRGGARSPSWCRDFIVDGGIGAYEKALRIAKRKHDVVPVIITDPMEEELPDVGFVYFEDLETGEVVAFDTAGPGRERYAATVKRARDEREALFRRHNMDFVNVRTDRAVRRGADRVLPRARAEAAH